MLCAGGHSTGPRKGIRAFTAELAAWAPEHFGKTDFKYVDDQPDSQMLKELKVFAVSERVIHSFAPALVRHCHMLLVLCIATGS
jgi:hypothetical protein